MARYDRRDTGDRIGPTCGAGQYRLSRHGGAPRLRRGDRRRPYRGLFPPAGTCRRPCRCGSFPSDLRLAPGFIDIQVNGGGDVLFNDAPTPEGLAAIVAAHRRFGTTALLPTLISDTPAKMRAALEAVRLTAPVNPGVLGIHLEGPFLSPGKPGGMTRR